MEITNSINNENLSLGNTKQFIIVHHTGSSASDQNNVDYLNKTDYISAHYLVGKEKGEVWQLVDDDRIAYHCGISEYDGYIGLNKYSIGIEVNSDGYSFTDVQKIASKELIQYLMNKYNIPSENVLRHRDIAPQRKWDIGDNFWNRDYKDWEDYQTKLNNMTILDEKLVEKLIAENSYNWHLTTNQELKRKLEECNKILRELI